MKYRSIIVYAIIITIIVSTIFVIISIPIIHTERISLVDGSELNISAKIEEYSNSLSVQNNVNGSISLVKLADNSKNVQMIMIYRYMNYFDNEELVLDSILFHPKDEVTFGMNFIYSYSWGKSEMKFKFDYHITYSNDSEISSSTNWLTFFTLRPIPNMKGIIAISIGLISALLFIGLLVNRKKKNKRIL